MWEGRRGDAYIVLLTEFLAQRSAHDDTALAGGSAEVRLARLSARRGDSWKVVSIPFSYSISIPRAYTPPSPPHSSPPVPP